MTTIPARQERVQTAPFSGGAVAQEGRDIQVFGVEGARLEIPSGGAHRLRTADGLLDRASGAARCDAGFDDPARHARALKTRGNHRDAHCILHVRIDHRAEDQVDIRVSGFLDDRRSLVDLEQGQVGTAGDVEQDAARAIDGDIQQLAGDGLLGSHAGASSPLAVPTAISAAPPSDMIVRTSAKSRLIRPGTVISSEMPWTPWRSTSSARRKACLQVGALVHDLQQAVVGDDDQGIGLLFELGDAGFGRLDAARAFEGEGAGDHANGQRADFLGDLRHDRRAAGAGAAAHAGGDEDHVGAFEHLVQLFGRFFGGLAARPRGCRPSPGRG